MSDYRLKYKFMSTVRNTKKTFEYLQSQRFTLIELCRFALRANIHLEVIPIISSSSDESTLSDDSEVTFISRYVYRHIE